MEALGSLRRRALAGTLAVSVVAALGAVTGVASADPTPLWKTEVAKIPDTQYSRDARLYVEQATDALRPFVGDGLGESRLEPVLADLDTRYIDGARLLNVAHAEAAFDNLQHFESFLKGRVNGASPPEGEAEQAHVSALVDSLTGVRMLADAAIHDAESIVGPFRANPPPAPAPAGLVDAFADIDLAKSRLAQVDRMLRQGNPEPAAVQAESAWAASFNVLTRLGITYAGDHDSDGVVDIVELRFGASPLLPDSDSDGLTDATEIYLLTGWTLPNDADSDDDGTPDGAEDVDGDGLTNLQEQQLGTKPTEGDTDGDGVGDGAEVANGTNPLVPDQPRPQIGGGAGPILPTPSDTDTDGDGLSDDEEDEILTDKTNVDTDGDGLSDGDEMLDWGINPLSADSDGDSLRDDYETVHAEDQGLDPGRFDQQQSKWSYVTDFLIGMFAGDFNPIDSMAWLAGNLCSGGLSAIPVVGWILGGLADLRDTIAGLIHGDWVSAGLSVLGVVPYVGDVIAIPGKAARFVIRFVHRLDETLRFVTRYDKVPDPVKDIALELILGGTYSFLQAGDQSLAAPGLSQVTGLAAVARTGRSRFSDEDIRQLSKGERTKWKNVEDAMNAPSHKPGDAVAPQPRASAGETAIRDLLGGCTKVKLDTTGFPGGRSRSRTPDCTRTDPETGGLEIHEVKTGVPIWTEDLIDECLKDAWSLTPAGRAVHGQNITKVHWHFVAHSRHNSVGIHPPLLQCLKDNNIPFTIHAPTDA